MIEPQNESSRCCCQGNTVGSANRANLTLGAYAEVLRASLPLFRFRDPMHSDQNKKSRLQVYHERRKSAQHQEYHCAMKHVCRTPPHREDRTHSPFRRSGLLHVVNTVFVTSSHQVWFGHTYLSSSKARKSASISNPASALTCGIPQQVRHADPALLLVLSRQSPQVFDGL